MRAAGGRNQRRGATVFGRVRSNAAGAGGPGGGPEGARGDGDVRG